MPSDKLEKLIDIKKTHKSVCFIGDGINAVSYTHLDVYKRQVNIKENDNVSDIKYATDDTINDWLDDDFFFTFIRYLYTVSYTHLDVYKRQDMLYSCYKTLHPDFADK